MIKLTFNNWTLSARATAPVMRGDDGTVDVVVSGIPVGWEWELLIRRNGADVLTTPMVEQDGALATTLTAEQLAYDGYYTMQLRATQGDMAKHSGAVNVKIGSTISGDDHWPEIPTAFTQAIARAEAAIADAQEVQEAVEQSAAEATQSATDAAQSATAAETARTAAENAQEAAEASADTATVSAATASQKATEAAASATAASASATATAESATDAAMSATAAAGSAASAAESATAAETAQTAAENAQEAAEEAQSAAEAATTQKADKVVGAVAGNLAALDGNGNLVDSGRKTTDFGRASDVQILYKLAKGQIYDTETDAQEAYAKTVPSGAVAAEIGSIGGKTVVWNQMTQPRQSQKTTNGVTFTPNSDYSITITGNPTGNAEYSFRARIALQPGHKILLLGTGFPRVNNNYVRQGFWTYGPDGVFVTADWAYGNDTIIIVNGSAAYYMSVVTVHAETQLGDGYTFTPIMVDLTQMFGAGNEPTTIDDPRIAAIEAYATEHPEYDAGRLLSAEVASVESVGKNLFDASASGHGLQSTLYYNVLGSDHGYNGERLVAGDYTLSFAANGNAFIYVLDVVRGIYILRGFSGTSKTFTIDEDSTYAIWLYLSGIDQLNVHDVQLERGSTPTAYTPYVGPLGALEIPVSLRTFLADKGYGWSAGSVYNELNLETKKYIQRVGSVDMGTLTWRYYGTSESYPYGFFYGPVANRKPGALKLVSAAYINKFGFIYNRVLFGNNLISDIYVIDDTYTDAATFKSAMSGVMLYYELAEPIEYDISSYLTDDNTMTVEPGGTLTFVQDGTKLDVPSSVEYLIKLSEVTP